MQAHAGNHTLTYMHTNPRTLLVTREDFNIEDIHCQMVQKVQREQQLLQEIEGNPAEAKNEIDIELLMQQPDENGKAPMLIDIIDGEEILCGDMCNKPAINWGVGNPNPPIIFPSSNG